MAAAVGDYIVFGSEAVDDDAVLFAYNKKTGETSSKTIENSGSIRTSVVTDGTACYFAGNTGNLYKAEIDADGICKVCGYEEEKPSGDSDGGESSGSTENKDGSESDGNTKNKADKNNSDKTADTGDDFRSLFFVMMAIAGLAGATALCMKRT